MKGSTISLLVVLGVFLLFAFWGCNAYNGFVSGEQGVKKAWSNVETNYQRRTDLYGSVIKTVEASANFEKSTLNSVVQARAAATQAASQPAGPPPMTRTSVRSTFVTSLVKSRGLISVSIYFPVGRASVPTFAGGFGRAAKFSARLS